MRSRQHADLGGNVPQILRPAAVDPRAGESDLAEDAFANRANRRADLRSRVFRLLLALGEILLRDLFLELVERGVAGLLTLGEVAFLELRTVLLVDLFGQWVLGHRGGQHFRRQPGLDAEPL